MSSRYRNDNNTRELELELEPERELELEPEREREPEPERELERELEPELEPERELERELEPVKIVWQGRLTRGMSIFNKKKKISPHPKSGDTDDNAVSGAAGINLSKREATIATAKGVVKRKLPADFDPTDKESVAEFLAGVLNEAGVLPPGATIESMEIRKVAKDEVPENGLERLFDSIGEGKPEKDETPDAIAKRFLKMRGHDTPDITLPQDPAKAEFVRALNCLHKKTHELAPMVADLMSSLECLRLVVKANPGDKQERAFKRFERHVTDALKAMDSFGSEVCSFSSKVAERGVPVPDTTSTTVN